MSLILDLTDGYLVAQSCILDVHLELGEQERYGRCSGKIAKVLYSSRGNRIEQQRGQADSSH